MTKHQQVLTHQFPDLPWELDKSLAAITYFKLGGPAEIFLASSDEQQLAAVIQSCSQHQIPVTYIGGASNVVVADEGIAGLVIQPRIKTWQLGNKIQDKQLCIVGADLQTALLVKKSIDAGLTGLEFFLGVPGNVGGAVVNNAHYEGHLIGEYISRVKVITASGEIKWVAQAEADFKYDHSRFQTSHELILEVEFLLAAGNSEVSRDLLVSAAQKRAATQPLGQPSSGCIFQNVPNTPQLQSLFPQFKDKPEVPASFLIDQAGLKGEKEGKIEISTKHAAFFINTGGGTSRDVLTLIDRVKGVIHAKFGVELKEEVFYLS